MTLEAAARAARAGNQILNFIVAVLILLMLLYGGYSLWDSYMTMQGAFVSDDLLQFKPVSGGETQDNPTLEELRAINPDVGAWVTIDDTHIDYPVVQGENDMEYVNKDVYGAFALSGSIFLSCLNHADFSDPYNLLYGHHMDNGGMFGDIAEFVNEAYFEAHRTGTLFLPQGTYPIRLFACVEADAYDETIYNVTAQQEDVGGLLAYVEKNATQYREIGAAPEDSIIAFSTCEDAVTNGRIIVFGVLEK